MKKHQRRHAAARRPRRVQSARPAVDAAGGGRTKTAKPAALGSTGRGKADPQPAGASTAGSRSSRCTHRRRMAEVLLMPLAEASCCISRRSRPGTIRNTSLHSVRVVSDRRTRDRTPPRNRLFGNHQAGSRHEGGAQRSAGEPYRHQGHRSQLPDALEGAGMAISEAIDKAIPDDERLIALDRVLANLDKSADRAEERRGHQGRSARRSSSARRPR